jgi:plasmid maintenance system killer protein
MKGSACMIVSFRDSWLRDFFVEDIRAKKDSGGFGEPAVQKAATVG